MLAHLRKWAIMQANQVHHLERIPAHMELNEYPRPANDTGLGVHWVVGYATALGTSRIREFWIPELKSMGIKWVKIFNHDGSRDFCELLLAEGIMPVVRLYRPNPNPGRLGVKELVHLDALIRAGVRYFEFNNEPDVDAEWKGGRVPVNGIELTVESTIANLEIILERGGMPAIPALANGSRWDLVGRIVAAGRKDLFAGPVWQAVHNFARNRPLDYPYDIGNQEGAAFTDRFHRVLAAESWGEDAWRGRSLSEVNRLRHDRRSPGASVMDDHACFLAYEYYDALNRKHLGRSIPILSTECGYLVGEDTDPRYPATTPDLHMAQTLESCRVMMGVSQRFKSAPDYYFCTAFWLLANQQLGSTSTWWESNAWYSERWPGGMLPVVRALQAEPKTARVAQTPVAPRITLSGMVANAAANEVLDLELDGRLAARTRLDADSRFSIPELQPGRYLLRIEGSSLAQPVELGADQQEVFLTLDARPAAEVISRSVIAGQVAGGGGAVVMLLSEADGAEWVTMARDDGSYRFVDLPPGTYKALVYPNGSQVFGIRVDGRSEAQVNLSVFGWGYTLGIASDVPKVGAIVVATQGHKGLRVQAHASEWSSEIALTGEAPDYGPFAALISPLEADYYIVTVDGAQDETGKPTQLEARVQVDKRFVPLVEFVYHEPVQQVQPPLDQGQALSQEAAAEARQAGYVTESLPSAAEETRVDDAVLAAAALEAAEDSARAAELAGGPSCLWGSAPDAGGRTVRLIDAVGNEQRMVADSDGHFQFDMLPPGVYSIFVEGGYAQADIEVDGSAGVEVLFAPVLTVWETTVTNAGSLPGYSSVRVEVEGMPNLPVRVWQGEEEGIVVRTGSVRMPAANAAEFRNLALGRHMIEPEGLGVWAEVEITGLEALWVTFRRKAEPIGANEVRRVVNAAAPAVLATVPVYLFVAAVPQRVDQQLALLRYVTEQHPALGNDLEEAAQAKQVLLIESDQGASIVEQQLLLRNVAVRRVTGDWNRFFAQFGA